MFGFKRKADKNEPNSLVENPVVLEMTVDEVESGKKSSLLGRLWNNSQPEAQASVDFKSEPVEKAGLFSRLKAGLQRTRANFTNGLANLLLGKKAIDDELLEEIETLLLTSDVGVEATQLLINDLTERVSRQQLADSGALLCALQEKMRDILQPVESPLKLPKKLDKPFVILMVGVNGVGKTTTIGKLAKKFQKEGYSVMLAAGDTFRAAAIEQLQVWGQRNQVPVIAQQRNADSASIIYDALQAATARHIDILIADTAGRLHTQVNLMEELKKVKRVISRYDPDAPHETMLVIDAGTGQNALTQAKQFHKTVGLSGITITKLDGTAKGGIIFAVAKQMGIPIRFIGVGEQVDDLRTFEADHFIDALLSRD